eukprot:jgi/Ulvmu1/10096/UM006_0043.1
MAMLQAQCDAVAANISSLQQQLAAAQDRSADLQRRRIAVSSRLVQAASDLKSLAAANASISTAPEHSTARSDEPPRQPGPRAATAPAATIRTCMSDSAASEQTETRSAACTSMRHGDVQSAVVPRRSRRDSMYAPYAQPPPAVSDFRTVAGISHDDVCAVAGAVSGLIDFTQHTLTTLVDTACAHEAERLGHGGYQGSICWFVQTKYEAARGVRISASATMSSPECLASYAAHFLIARLEFVLITTAAQCLSAGREAACNESDTARPAQKARHHGSSCPSDPRRPPRAETVTCSPHTRTTTGGSPAAHDGDGTRPSTPPQAGTLWSGRLRCGVNDTCDARAALRRIVEELVRRCCRIVPLDTISRIMEAYHVYLQRTGVRPGRGGAEQRPQGSGPAADGAQAYMIRSVAAALGAAQAVEDAVAVFADMHELRQLREQFQAAPADDTSALESSKAQAHVSLTIFAMLNCLALPQTTRMIYTLSNYAVFPLTQFHEDFAVADQWPAEQVETMHVHLYRQLQVTPDQLARLAGHWTAWRGFTSALDAKLSASLRLFSNVSCAEDLPRAFVTHITGLASGTSSLRDPRLGPKGVPGAAAALCELCGLPRAKHTAQCENDADDSTRPPQRNGVLRLLGCSAAATAAAVKGLRGLVSMHESHGRVIGHIKEYQLQPGVLLDALQLARIYGAHVLSGTAPADMLQLCQLADPQQRWSRAWARLTILVTPARALPT